MQPDYKKIKALIYPDEFFDLKGKIVLIFGGAGKMGHQFAQTLSLAGANVTISDYDQVKCKQVKDRLLADMSINVETILCDVRVEEEIRQTISEVIDKHGKLDVLIYNVMAKPEGYYASLQDYSREAWDTVLSGNLTGAFFASRETSREMKKRRVGGSIIFTSSTYGMVGPDQRIYRKSKRETNIYGGDYPLNLPASYSASKSGLLGLTRYLATTLGEDQIRVNALTPGGVYDGQEETFHSEYIKRTVLGRMATWSDYNGAVLFLASEASRYMTGSNLVIDGGWTAW